MGRSTTSVSVEGSRTEATEARGNTVVADDLMDPVCAGTRIMEGSHCSVRRGVKVAREEFPTSGRGRTARQIPAEGGDLDRGGTDPRSGMRPQRNCPGRLPARGPSHAARTEATAAVLVGKPGFLGSSRRG